LVKRTEAEDYLDLPWHFRLVYDGRGAYKGWFVEVEELPGCMSQGDDPNEAIARGKDAILAWIDAALEEGDEIPMARWEDEPVDEPALISRG
jgi:antitoxin HicB